MTPRFFSLFVFTLVLAVCLLYFSKPLAEHFARTVSKKSAAQKPEQVAQVVEVIGVASVKMSFSNKQVALENEKLPYIVYHQDKLQLMSGSLVRLLLSSGAEIIFNENSEAFIEYFNPKDILSPVYIYVRRGELEVKNAGVPGRLFIVKNRKVLSPAQLLNAKKPELKTVTVDATPSKSSDSAAGSGLAAARPAAAEDDNDSGPPSLRNAQNNPILKIGNKETLTNDYIEARLASQFGHFRRCQINSLRDRENAIGRLTYSLRIESTGKITMAQLVSATATGSLLQSCVKDVLSRVVFRQFKGDAILINYPIDFQ
jgi:hypothetical protein